MWVMVCHSTPICVTVVHVLTSSPPRAPYRRRQTPRWCAEGQLAQVAASVKVFSRWIEEMPMIAMASFTLSTEALTWLNHSGWSG